MPDPAAHEPTVVATGIGSWPGTDVREALRVVRGELAASAPEGVTGMPYLSELPARGPGADLLGRTAHLLVDLPVDLQPQGWRLVARPGRDHERAGSWWRQDLDELAEAFDGWAGPLKVQVAGPWTLAAGLWLPLGDRVLSDRGATRDLVGSLAEGVAAHVADVRRLVPGAQVVLQVDEPTLPTVLLGRVRSDSGFRVLRTPGRGEVVAALRTVLEGGGADLAVLHTCASDPPVDVLVQAGAGALALDVAQLDRRRWEELAPTLEAGTALWAGLLPTSGEAPAPDAALAPLLRGWHELGLEPRDLARVAVTPACGLAGATPDQARALTGATVTTAARLAEVAAD
ncbi:uroporphyrinogen decarboxylase/cobalamine-independent methonine synthase family protein [Ornithinimicrobium avium]|uniref:Methionine synthase n=1 Tax=Ornithinimicrobium avium TaxID=2283195 RepID=A0A345NM29_9MICO|nr:methionine synthase [Ornithinimicrobium avium]AXH96087.1 methionine synthase [Ornithinimicrobium avium]